MSDHDPDTGEAVSCVFGIAKGVVHTSEGAEALLTRLGLRAHFAKLTWPSGAPIWLNAKAVHTVRAPLEEEYIPAVHAVVSVGAMSIGVAEAVEAAATAITAAGGTL